MNLFKKYKAHILYILILTIMLIGFYFIYLNKIKENEILKDKVLEINNTNIKISAEKKEISTKLEEKNSLYCRQVSTIIPDYFIYKDMFIFNETVEDIDNESYKVIHGEVLDSINNVSLFYNKKLENKKWIILGSEQNSNTIIKKVRKDDMLGFIKISDDTKGKTLIKLYFIKNTEKIQQIKEIPIKSLNIFKNDSYSLIDYKEKKNEVSFELQINKEKSIEEITNEYIKIIAGSEWKIIKQKKIKQSIKDGLGGVRFLIKNSNIEKFQGFQVGELKILDNMEYKTMKIKMQKF